MNDNLLKHQSHKVNIICSLYKNKSTFSASTRWWSGLHGTGRAWRSRCRSVHCSNRSSPGPCRFDARLCSCQAGVGSCPWHGCFSHGNIGKSVIMTGFIQPRLFGTRLCWLWREKITKVYSHSGMTSEVFHYSMSGCFGSYHKTRFHTKK